MKDAKPRILVVDDEPDARSYLFDLLDSEGYRVATCENGLEALKHVEDHKPDLVVSDVRMPGIEGLELLAKIKHVSPATQVILISAYADRWMYVETLQKGGGDLLLKPFRNEEILRTVERVLEAVTPPKGGI